MSNQKHLWAPWKMDYLKNKKQDSQKIFSDFANEENDKKNLILHRAKYCYVIMNYYPYNNGHLMVIPFNEVDKFEDLEDKIKEIDCTNNWVIGGEDIYKYFINKPVRHLYITRVYNDYECDAFFPDIPSHFELKSRSKIKKENGEYFHYEVLQDPNYFFKVMK